MKKIKSLLGVFFCVTFFMGMQHLKAERKKLERINVVQPSENGEKLIEFAKTGNLDDVKDCIENKELTQDDFNLALGWATNEGQIEIVRYLLEKGANVNARNICKLHASPITIATIMRNELVTKMGEKRYLAFLELLLDMGADVNSRSRTESTPIVDLIVLNDIKACILLLERGARCDLPTYNQQYPHNACTDNAALKWLIECISYIDWLRLPRVLKRPFIYQLKKMALK